MSTKNKFADKAMDLIDWMLKGSYAQKINTDLQTYVANKTNIGSAAFPRDILMLIIDTKITNSFYRSLDPTRKRQFEKP
jgi:hypothetical protein